LHKAASRDGEDFAEAVSILIDKGADLNARNGIGKTPLMYAAGADFNVNLVSLKALLAAGPDVGIKDNKGKTALAWSEERGKKKDPEVVNVLMKC
jgi:ankyrin repeat protein